MAKNIQNKKKTKKVKKIFKKGIYKRSIMW